MDMNKYNEWPANHKGDKNPSPKIIALLGTRRDHYRGNGRGRSYHEKTCALHV